MLCQLRCLAGENLSKFQLPASRMFMFKVIQRKSERLFCGGVEMQGKCQECYEVNNLCISPEGEDIMEERKKSSMKHRKLVRKLVSSLLSSRLFSTAKT